MAKYVLWFVPDSVSVSVQAKVLESSVMNPVQVKEIFIAGIVAHVGKEAREPLADLLRRHISVTEWPFV